MLVIAAEIAVIIALLIVNGIFAMSELAVVTSKRIRLEHRAEEGDEGARAALRLAKDPTGFLSTVQVGITLVGVFAGAFGGATLSARLAVPMAHLPYIGVYAETIAFVLVVAGITYLSLIIGELVPKRIALSNPETVAALVARPMTFVARMTRPLVHLLTASTRGVLRLFGMRDVPEPGLTEEEIHALVEQGAESGAVPEVEHEIVESVFRLGDRQVASIMTARPDIDWIDIDTPDDVLRRELQEQRRPWYLVCEDHVEQVRGIAHASDIVALLSSGKPLNLRAVLAEPLYVPASMPVFRLLEVFRPARRHIAIALDEYGGVAGLITLEDIVEELVGEIPSYGEEAEQPQIRRVDGGWLAIGSTPIEDVAEELEIGRVDVNDQRGYRTLGGFILSQLGHVPAPGEVIEWDGYRFEVVTMDGRRIDQVKITSVP